MTKSYEDLRKQYPELYGNIPFECGIGWYDLLEELSKNIKASLKVNPINQYIYDKADLDSFVSQVKEKYGGLRYYIFLGTDEIYDLINEAENSSYNICEECGKPGKTYGTGWRYTRCLECWEKRNDKLARKRNSSGND